MLVGLNMYCSQEQRGEGWGDNKGGRECQHLLGVVPTHFEGMV